MDKAFLSVIEFLYEVDKMKNVLRQTLNVDGARRENDAEHSWHFAIAALTLKQYGSDDSVNIDRVVRMALVHDLVEIYAGDTFAYDTTGYSDKRAREIEAADRLFSLLPDDLAAEYRSLWEEFDAEVTPDALFATAIDRLQPFMLNMINRGHTWRLHGVTAEQVRRRMEPIKRAIPQAYEYVESEIGRGIGEGFLAE